MYALVTLNKKGEYEYLRDGWTSKDAYTDDLGHAQLFTTIADAKKVRHGDEKIGYVEKDEDGVLYFPAPSVKTTKSFEVGWNDDPEVVTKWIADQMASDPSKSYTLTITVQERLVRV
ncbi:hypothetical protein [Brevibacillus sp. NRS-1366]|uniref:hypothetical protein n=1 Tax=Brevibacillus sp. NRS-1366 TaxID=3233899 RepID=UPI003D195467